MSWSQEWQVFSQNIFKICFLLRIGKWPYLNLSIICLSINVFYYSFKIFLGFWLAKITCIIHHNQLLFTKFGRIFPHWIDHIKSAAKLQIIEPLTDKTWGRVWVVFEVSNGETCYLIYGELLSKDIARTARRLLDGQHLLFGVYLQSWTALYLLNFPIKMHCRHELNIAFGLGG